MMSVYVFSGSSPPEVVLSLPGWQPAMHPGSLEEAGPLVEHVYEVIWGCGLTRDTAYYSQKY